MMNKGKWNALNTFIVDYFMNYIKGEMMAVPRPKKYEPHSDFWLALTECRDKIIITVKEIWCKSATNDDTYTKKLIESFGDEFQLHDLREVMWVARNICERIITYVMEQAEYRSNSDEPLFIDKEFVDSLKIVNNGHVVVVGEEVLHPLEMQEDEMFIAVYNFVKGEIVSVFKVLSYNLPDSMDAEGELELIQGVVDNILDTLSGWDAECLADNLYDTLKGFMYNHNKVARTFVEVIESIKDSNERFEYDGDGSPLYELEEYLFSEE